MKKPQLYIKNSKGRYEPYQEPQPEPDHNIYRRYGKKYEQVWRAYKYRALYR